MAIYEQPAIAPDGYIEVELLPQQTGLRGPRYTYVKDAVVERDIDPDTGQDRSLPKIRRNIYDNRTTNTEEIQFLELNRQYRQYYHSLSNLPI